MKYMKEYKFDSQNNNRGFWSSVFDVEERLIFDMYVCPNCKHSEFLYKGADTWLDDG
jgi:predicted nucleic-acid-binding Zn-ribbon protein